jgi:hypothetical protein
VGSVGPARPKFLVKGVLGRGHRSGVHEERRSDAITHSCQSEIPSSGVVLASDIVSVCPQ